MDFSLIDVVRASFSNLLGTTRNISMLHRGINKLNYDFDVVRVVRTLKNVSTAMQAFLSEPNKIYLRYSAQNVVQTSSDEEKILRDWNCNDNYLDLSPNEEKDKEYIKRMVVYKMVPPDFNAPLVAE